MHTAHGTFEVTLNPLAQDGEESPLGRMSIDKRFAGDLEGTSTGQMLTAQTGVEGSAVYVALERVSGTLHGRRGSFVLQHSGVMVRGQSMLTITIVPDSGTDELEGIAGRLAVTIDNGAHSYDLTYTFGDGA
jgi:hypothetical protein